ncbi:winged helix DNA-binding domain-containing protein [Actinopolymorpha alba]|uniref:winged helix DNA-binding domain-containing protein n=1 Tax=Actinopolymorpha alba TaxID=533267 RepID=UPI00036E60FC|nr:winged helix DNA-binding domain-containing protein [Actinopolymorpha alba]
MPTGALTKAAGRGGDVLSQRALNRALLERQLLLRRASLSVADAVEHLVGLQAQAPIPPYFGLWSRLMGFQTDQLADLLTSRQAVRIVLMRGTIHLVTARDCLAIRPVTQAILDRDLYANTTHGPALRRIDLGELVAAGRALLEERPRTAKELGGLLNQRWPDRDPASLAHAIRSQLPLVQVPPRGIWGASGQPTHTPADAWLRRPLSEDRSPDDLLLRYLAAFGPATVADMQTWSGLTGLREVIERLAPRLRAFQTESGRQMYDLPDAPRPDPDTPAPPRFIAAFDNLLLSHDDRTRVLADEDRRRVFGTRNAVIPGTLLVDGYVRGTWKITRARARGTATLLVETFRQLSKRHTATVSSEGARLLRFAAADAGTHDVRITVTD